MARVYVRLQRIHVDLKEFLPPSAQSQLENINLRVRAKKKTTGVERKRGMVVPSNRTDGAPAGSVSDPGPFVRVRIGKKSGLVKSGSGSMKKRPKTVSTSKKKFQIPMFNILNTVLFWSGYFKSKKLIKEHHLDLISLLKIDYNFVSIVRRTGTF